VKMTFLPETNEDVRRGSGVIVDVTPRLEQLIRLRESAKMAKKAPGLVLSEQMALKTFDPTGDTWVVFQRPRRLEEERLDTMQLRAEVVWNTAREGEMRQRDRTPMSVIESEQVCMALVECNMPGEDDKLIFTPGKTSRAAGQPLEVDSPIRKAFYEAWHSLDSTICDEIVQLLQEFHPPYDWRHPERGEA